MSAPNPADEPPVEPRDLVVLLLILTVVSGIVDAVSFLGLGDVFVANMTGNIVFFGFAAAGQVGHSILPSLTAIAAFLAGAFAGGRLSRRAHGRALLRRATMLQAVPVTLAVVVSAVFGSAGRPAAEVLIVLLGFAMGLQNAAARDIGLADLQTTVFTRTVTALAADAKVAGGKGSRPGRKLTVIGAILLGALVGGLLQLHVATWTALALALTLIVTVSVVLRVREGRTAD
ncbi:YoaK family protein [Amycolatopsis sp. NPDC059027]|uniref:YoaK family protein n=1 Tax=unclassified Amycolatopsis TaxID=2618356 RepID=UPI00366EEBB8